MNNVIPLKEGLRPATGEPDLHLVQILEDLLEKAKTGELRSFCGTGYLEGGDRMTMICDRGDTSVFAMSGAIAYLQHEYFKRYENH